MGCEEVTGCHWNYFPVAEALAGEFFQVYELICFNLIYNHALCLPWQSLLFLVPLLPESLSDAGFLLYGRGIGKTLPLSSLANSLNKRVLSGQESHLILLFFYPL